MLARPAGHAATTRRRRIVIARVVTAIAIALTVANCSSTRTTRRGADAKYGVKPSPKVIPDGEPIPKGGGRAMVGKPYVVGGQTYVPTGGRGYDREGSASWYGTAFHGRLTANGEVFDRDSIVAAHPTLPLPSYVRVTNLANRRSMIVRVNDRGPYERSRLIDVSERVAETLEFHRRGTTQVRVEYVGKASTNGSDDAKLLATLRTDGTPAPFGWPRAPVMMADLRARDLSPVPPITQARTAPALARELSQEGELAQEDEAPASAQEGISPPIERTSPRAHVQVSDAAPSDDPGPERYAAGRRPDAQSPPAPVLPPARPILAGIY